MNRTLLLILVIILLLAVLPSSWNRPEELGINVVDKNRATAVQSGSSGVFVKP